MKTIYLLQRINSYDKATTLRAYESKVDAEDIIALMARAGFDKLELVELELETAQPHTPLPMQPRQLAALQIGKEVTA